MKKKLTTLALSFIACFCTIGIVSCNSTDGPGENNFGKKDEDWDLPNIPETPSDKDSWLYNNEKFSINWFVDYSWFSYPEAANTSDKISNIIKEKTGVTVTFNSPVDDSGQMLSTMIAGDTLPDVISVKAYTSIASKLAREGYVYPLDLLAKKWAPSLTNRIEDDIFKYYQMSDNHLYGLPSCAYSNKYVGPNDKWEPNGAMLVRKDWYEWYMAQPDSKDITTPRGLLDAMSKVKAQFEGNGAGKVPNMSAMLLDQFTSEGNNSVTWLSQFFASPFEDQNGNFVDERTTNQYKEALTFLNEAYRSGLIRQTNLSATADSISGIISRGEAFVSLVTPQNYTGSFINSFSSGKIEYIPLYVTNEAGEDPILQDLTGNGFILNMITKNAKNIDKIIKVFDFLYSEEGQLLCSFGIEGDTYKWNENKSRIQWTKKYLDMKSAGTLGSYGLGKFNVMYNHAFIDPIYPLEGKTAGEAYFANLKRPLTPFSYRYTIRWPNLDSAHPDYNKIITSESNCNAVWAEKLPQIISAKSQDKALANYESTMKAMNSRGFNNVIKFYGDAYKKNKELLGVEWGWPKNKPEYTSPKLRNLDGSYSNEKVGPNGDPYYILKYIIV